MAKKHLSEDEIKLIISGDSSKLQEELHTLTKETKALKKEESERRKAMVELEAQGKKNTKDYQNLAKECKDYTAKISKNNEKISLLTRNLKVNDLTMRQLKKEAKELSAALDDMTESANPEEYAKLNTRLREVRARMSELRSAGNNMNNEFGNSVNWMSKLKIAAKAFIAVKVVGWLKDVHNQAYETRKEFAKYEAVLRNTFQSQKKANDAMKMLQQLAADTPSSLQEWTEAYIKLVNRGVKPTSQELVNMGDLAASQGKSVDQLIEAILDAMTGENERLKEFGIKASKSGETTKFSFRGMTTEVRNSEDAIKDYLLSLGRVDGIAGSMAVQMQELEGIQSNLGDTMDAFFNKVGKKLEPFWKSMLKYANGFFTKLGEMFTTYTETYENHFDKMVQLESALPGLLNRYEELTGKSSRSAEEQKELANVIAQIKNMVPGAVSAFDEYGRAIAISGEKVEEFLIKQRALLKFENQKAIKEITKQIENYRKKIKELQEQYTYGKTNMVGQGMFASPIITIDKSDTMKKATAEEIENYSNMLLGAEEKLKQLNGQTIEETVKNQQKLAEARQNFNKMEKVQLQAWIKNNKDAAGEYVEIAQEIYNKRFPAEDSDATRKKAEKAAKEAKSAAEKEQKAKVSTEQEAAKSLEALREEELQSQQKWYNDSFADLSAFLASGKMSKEQYEMLVLELEKSYAENRLIIEQSYYEDAISMAISNAETKENLVRKSNQRVIDAEKAANAKRASLQEKLNTLVKDFKSEFKVTTVDEDYAAQLKVLEASYQARKEMAEKNNLDTTELYSAYLGAKEQLESEHKQRIQSIRDQYGLSTQQERFNAELEQLRLAREQQFLTEEQYEQAVQNLKRDSYKKQFDYYSSLFSGAIQALQQAEMDQVDAKYDAEIEAAQGNTEEVERLENEKAQKKLDIQKKYADVNFAIKASQIIADTAVSIMKAYADLGPIAGSIAAALMGVTGAAQLASAKAERDKIKNMTLSGSNSGSSGTGARVATGRQSGGKIDVRRAQDGKLFPDADYDPDARGFIDRPTVIVGEGPSGQSKEWVASNAAVSNHTVAPILDILDKSQQAGTIRTLDLNQAIRARMVGYSSGGSIDAQKSAVPIPPAPSGTSLPPRLMERLANAIIRIDEEGIPASVTLSELERKQELRNRSRKIGSK
ncbi:hypothetical protein M1B78_13760 [Bacteroides sp. KH569_7]|uniref:Phage tail tape measure protein n=1 Tax=Bacteroides muris (ex Fokt et al. 2023) TaxID=2937417 RepID=A0A9X2NZG6_9BACE|nr:hypothetical protein [Bacteroides muris (ex Fokt et al. 2023)]MCR6509196.1 hypothetical protein [Bacteroides muris (ex Fokt et al. 2023)]